jgi:hypothetical protein
LRRLGGCLHDEALFTRAKASQDIDAGELSPCINIRIALLVYTAAALKDEWKQYGIF